MPAPGAAPPAPAAEATNQRTAAPPVDSLVGWIPRDRSWVPSLRYLMRRARILPLLGPGHGLRALEVGCGAGTLLIELRDRGYACTGLESSGEALAVARNIVRGSGRDVEIVSRPPAWNGSFDLVTAFDVLEHIDDDAGALRRWTQWLAPGGRMILSVPAHPSRWGSGDVWAGHFRRYTRQALVTLAEASGLRVEHIECYGFPVANATELLGERYYRRALAARRTTPPEATGNELSGIDRGAYRKAVSGILSPAGRLVIRAGCWLQARFIDTDLGSGYLIVAKQA